MSDLKAFAAAAMELAIFIALIYLYLQNRKKRKDGTDSILGASKDGERAGDDDEGKRD